MLAWICIDGQLMGLHASVISKPGEQKGLDFESQDSDCVSHEERGMTPPDCNTV